MFSATPAQVVARKPTAGMSQKPAAMAPAAAPVVLAAYRTPADASRRNRLRLSPGSDPEDNQTAAIGKVAPIATAGAPTRRRLTAMRTNANRAGAVPSAY